jgi:hypothetical protein
MKKEANKILKDLRENFLSEKHRHAEMHWGCAECLARMLEGGLEWYKEMVDDKKEDSEVDDKPPTK